MIKKWIRFSASKGMYLYNEKQDICVKVTTILPDDEGDWSEVDEYFRTEWQARKDAEAEEEAEGERVNE